MKYALGRFIFVVLCGLAPHTVAMGQDKGAAMEVDLQPNHIRALEGEISRGIPVSLPFNTESGIACFPATDHSHFSGHHVWYHLKLPARASLDASLYSDGDMSLYAFLMPAGELNLPPTLGQVLSCEASHLVGNGPGRPEIVKLESDSAACEVVIGVVGANGLKSGSFALNLGLKLTAVPDAEVDRDRTPKIVSLDLKAGEEREEAGELGEGKAIPLDWASQAEIACFPGSQHAHYRGRHVFYALELPARSELVVELAEGTNMNLYGLLDYEGSAPPDISRCSLCESSRTDAPGQVIRLTAIDKPEKVLIGVAGSSWVRSGSYRLKFRLVDRSARSRPVMDSRPPKVVKVKAQRSERLSLAGNIADGKEIPLEWASTEKVNCFPSPEADHFRGRQVFYTLDLPNHSELVVRLRDSRNINLYVLQGYDAKSLPPSISACASSQSSYSDDSPQVLRISAGEKRTPVLIGVAGLSGILSGDYTLDLHCIDRRPEDLRIEDDKPAKVYAMRTELGKAFATSGELGEGKRIPLAWAESEGLDCFIGNQAEAFRGNHLFYQLEIPAHSRLLVKLQSEANINLYAVSGHDGQSLPPDIGMAEGCASAFIVENDWKRLLLSSGDQPQKVLVGVAGARNVLSGTFKMVVQVTAER